MADQFQRICKLSQDATNELWSVTLRRQYETPGEKKRAVERVIRGALEAALDAPCTVSGHEAEVDVPPIFGYVTDVPRVTPNPYEDAA